MRDNTTIDWSYSNAQLYESCPRSLFYHYWQNINRNTDAEPAKRNVLRGQSRSGAIIGNAIHTALDEHISRWSRGKETGIKIIRQVARDYISDAINSNIGIDINPESLVHTTDAHIRRFFQVIWPQIRGHRYILHEKTDSFEVGSTKVWVRPDLCTRDSGEFVITDWKSRQPELFEDPSLQLRIYALWAHRGFEPDIDRISIQLVFTSDGRIDHQSVSEEELTRIKDRIADDVALWGNPNDRTNFPTDGSFEKCSNCPYLHSCSAGKRIIRNSQ